MSGTDGAFVTDDDPVPFWPYPLIEDPASRFDQIHQSIGGMDDKG